MSLGATACASDDEGLLVEPDPPVELISLTGYLRTFDPSGSGEPIEGASVCLLDTDTCLTTDERGKYVVEAPAATPFGLVYEKEGYLGTIRLGHWGEDVPLLGATALLTLAQLDAIVTASGEAPTGGATERGAVHFVGLTDNPAGFDAPRAGVTVALEPARGLGPLYADATNALDPALGATAALGWGVFVDVPAGEYLLRFSSPLALCDVAHPLGGWPSDEAEAVRTLVRPGFVTLNMFLSCADE